MQIVTVILHCFGDGGIYGIHCNGFSITVLGMNFIVERLSELREIIHRVITKYHPLSIDI